MFFLMALPRFSLQRRARGLSHAARHGDYPAAPSLLNRGRLSQLEAVLTRI